MDSDFDDDFGGGHDFEDDFEVDEGSRLVGPARLVLPSYCHCSRWQGSVRALGTGQGSECRRGQASVRACVCVDGRM